MIPTVQFDPATLTIWTTTGLLPEPVAGYAKAAMDAAVRGENPAHALTHLPENDPLRLRLLWLASAVWHEKRHFFDTCLTNYGARRFRDLFSLAVNFYPLLDDLSARGEPVWFPVELYANKVRRSALGIGEPSAKTLLIAQLAQKIKRMSAELDSPPGVGDKLIHVGAEAQMEGLAQVSQTHAIEHRYGLDELVGVTTEYLHRLPMEGPYRAIEVISRLVGCSAETKDGHIIVNSALAGALFVAALCGRFYGVGLQAPEDLISPWPRLARLLEALGPKPGSFHMSDEEAWSLVDNAARKLWGRGTIEEITADIDASETILAKLEGIVDESLTKAFADFIGMRRKLLAAVQAAGPASLLPRAFPTQWVDRLLPLQIAATPAGDTTENGPPVVFGIDLKPSVQLVDVIPSRTSWGRVQKAPPELADKGFAPSQHAAWIEMMRRYGPAALLMLNGRRHRRMVPPELEASIADTERVVPVRFDPHFEWPEQRNNAVRCAEAEELARFSDRSHFNCDVTGDIIEPTEAAVLTPWELRRSPLVEQVREVGIVAQIMLQLNWSDWVVRRDLLD